MAANRRQATISPKPPRLSTTQTMGQRSTPTMSSVVAAKAAASGQPTMFFFKLPETFHTQGFYARESMLMRELLGESPASPGKSG